MSSGAQALAIHGGPPAVDSTLRDRYRAIGEQEVAAVVETLTGGSPYRTIAAFEEEFRAFTGSRYVLAQNNGTSCLHAAFFAAGVTQGTEVIVPSYTWHATLTPILHCGGTPVFADIDERTHCLDPAAAEQAITPRTRAIAITHVYGNICDLDAFTELARRHGLALIEDCSHAHGGLWRGKPVGSWGQVGCFSLQSSKAVSGVEAGVLCTDDTDLYEKMVVLGHYGRIPELLVTDKYRGLNNIGLGIKYRANPLALAMARVQLRRLPELNAGRARTFAYWDEHLATIPGITPVQTLAPAQRGGLLQYTATYDETVTGLPIGDFLTAVRAEGVNTTPSITPLGYGKMHLEPAFNDFPWEGFGGPWGNPGAECRRPLQPGSLPVSERVASRVFWLPAFIDPAPGLLEQYVQALAKVVRAGSEGG